MMWCTSCRGLTGVLVCPCCGDFQDKRWGGSRRAPFKQTAEATHPQRRTVLRDWLCELVAAVGAWQMLLPSLALQCSKSACMLKGLGVAHSTARLLGHLRSPPVPPTVGVWVPVLSPVKWNTNRKTRIEESEHAHHCWKSKNALFRETKITEKGILPRWIPA